MTLIFIRSLALIFITGFTFVFVLGLALLLVLGFANVFVCGVTLLFIGCLAFLISFAVVVDGLFKPLGGTLRGTILPLWGSKGARQEK